MGRWFLSFLFLAISPLDAMSLKSGESFPDLQFPSIHGGEKRRSFFLFWKEAHAPPFRLLVSGLSTTCAWMA